MNWPPWCLPDSSIYFHLLGFFHFLAKKHISEEKKELSKYKLRICSENNFATAAGLASSAAGFACLVYCLAQVYGIDEKVVDLTILARRGSGSACRSIYGGFVWWQKGTSDDGHDSKAVQVASEARWPELRAVILVVSHKQKDVSSKDGMKRSRETSQLLHFRSKQIVQQRIESMIKAINAKDFDAFAEITMKESNQFHAVALDTFPPCFYMNDVSRNVIDLVNKYNAYKVDMGSSTRYSAAYTFDAGPNACIYLQDKDLSEFLSIIVSSFPSIEKEYVRGLPVEVVSSSVDIFPKHAPGALDYIICTKVGPGPRVIESDHLLNPDGSFKV
ncbi:diphosphomevalonate decarboxylase-like [Artemia franciscana]|uniref:diphosphomevalonate decarboxylase-like n=1 Tax=Artemia franciscana TaxID=6661 RepID=UPI0032DB719A